MVVNGDFATDSDWTKQVGWSIASGSANCNDSTGFRNISQSSLVNTVGKTYKVTYEVSNYVSGAVRCILGGFALGQVTSSNGIVTETITTSNASSNTFVYLETRGSGFIGSIDNVSVKEYLGQEVVPDSGCGSWLLEPQSTNLVTYSEDFSQWVSIDGVVITDNFTTSPDGTQNASKLVFNGTANSRIELQVSSSGTNAQSVYLKTESGTQNVSIGSSSTNLTEFTITDQWVRYTHAGSGTYPRILCSDAATIYVWGCQYESGDTSTSYIPTNGAANTRLQDIANNSGNSTLINSTEGVLYANLSDIKSQNFDSIIINNGIADENNQVRIWFYNNTLTYQYKVGSVPSAQITSGTIDLTLDTKIACSWKLNEFKLFVNGSKIGQDLSGNVLANGTLESVDFKRGNNIGYFYGKTKALAVYKEALTDAELQSLTTI